MTFLKVILIVLLILWMISLIRLGGIVRYGTKGLEITVIAGPAKFRIPGKGQMKKGTRRKKAKKAEEKKPSPPEADKRPAGGSGTLSRVRQLLPVIGEAAGGVRRKIRMDDVELSLIWGGTDPFGIALGYGEANAALGMIWPVLDHNFNIKNYGFHIDLDYERTEPVVELYAALTITIGQAVSLGVRYGWKMLMIWRRSGKRSKK